MFSFITTFAVYGEAVKPKEPFFSTEQKRLAKKSIKIALFGLESTVSFLALYLINFYWSDFYTSTNYSTPSEIALHATPQYRRIVNAGFIFFGLQGLWELYDELDIPKQVKKVIKLLKKDKNKYKEKEKV